MSYQKSFQNRLRLARYSAGFTQRELAEKIGKSHGVISHWEHGYYSPSIDMLVKLSRILNTHPNYLLGWEDLQIIDRPIKEVAA